jgi:hypothetical protein
MEKSQTPRGLQRFQAKATFCENQRYPLYVSPSYRVVTSDDELSTSLDP